LVYEFVLAGTPAVLLTDTLNEEDRDGLGEWDGVMVRSPGRSIVGMVA